jgi:hypothetical protein
VIRLRIRYGRLFEFEESEGRRSLSNAAESIRLRRKDQVVPSFHLSSRYYINTSIYAGGTHPARNILFPAVIPIRGFINIRTHHQKSAKSCTRSRNICCFDRGSGAGMGGCAAEVVASFDDAESSRGDVELSKLGSTDFGKGCSSSAEDIGGRDKVIGSDQDLEERESRNYAGSRV